MTESKIHGNSLGASGFTLGVVGCVTLNWIGLILSIVGFILCFFQQKNKKTKLGKAGLIINVIVFVLSILWIIFMNPILTQLMTQVSAGA